MTEAEEFRDNLTNAIDEHGSTVVITPRTLTEGSYGGYDVGSDTDSTAVTTKGLPSGYLLSKTGRPFGKLQTGEAVIVLKYDEAVEKDYLIAWKDVNYSVQEVKEVTMQDTIIGKRIKISRKLD